MNPVFIFKTLLKIRALRKRDFWIREEIQTYQEKALLELRQHAYVHSAFYQSFHQGKSDAPLHELPVLTKRMLMENYDAIATNKIIHLEEVRNHIERKSGEKYEDTYWVNTTAGSTGQPGIFLFDDEEWQTVLASFARAQEWSGVKISLFQRTKRAIVSSTAQTYMSALVGKTIDNALMATLRLDATEPIEKIVERLNEWRPEVLVSYAAMAALLAKEQLAGRLKIRPEVVFTSSEVLTEDGKKEIKRAWGKEPFNEYASTETATIAADCEYHRMHLFEDLILTEVVDADNRPVPFGQFGEKLLVNVLFSRTLPLIRYEISDSLKLSKEVCPCGRHTLVVQEIQGRREDVLIFKSTDGSKIDIHPNSFHALMEGLPVSAWQIIQDGTTLEILLANLQAGFDTSVLTGRFNTLLSSKNIGGVGIQIHSVEAIPKTSSGKTPLIRKIKS